MVKQLLINLDPLGEVVWVRLPDQPLIQPVSCGLSRSVCDKGPLDTGPTVPPECLCMILEAKPGQSVLQDCFDRPLIRGDEIVGKPLLPRSTKQ